MPSTASVTDHSFLSAQRLLNFLRLDVEDSESITQFAKTQHKHLQQIQQPLKVLVNNAGVVIDGSVLQQEHKSTCNIYVGYLRILYVEGTSHGTCYFVIVARTSTSLYNFDHVSWKLVHLTPSNTQLVCSVAALVYSI